MAERRDSPLLRMTSLLLLGRAYQMKRIANSTSRGSPGPPEIGPASGRSVLKILPKLGEARSRCGMSKLGWLVTLNISVRNSSERISPILKLRIIAISQLFSGGPVRMFRPALPNVYGAEALKAEGSSHCPG